MIIPFASAIANPGLVSRFDPLADILLFEVPAASVKVAMSLNSISFTTALGTVTLPVSGTRLTSGQGGALRFIDNSELLIGDATPAQIADDLANQLNRFATDQGDQMIGLGGDDTLNGGRGNDLLYGNTGNDFIYGNSTGGHDTVYGGRGDDLIDYYSGVIAYGNLGDDTIYGASTEADRLYGGQGDDLIYGNGGDDLIYGNAGNDLIGGDDGSDTLFGGAGDDTVLSGYGAGINHVYGNIGDDSLVAQSAPGAGGAVDTLFGGQGDDTIAAYATARLLGNAGADLFQILGSGLAVTVEGGAGADTISADLSLGGETMVIGMTAEDVIALAGASAVALADNAVGGAITGYATRINLFSGADLRLQTGTGAIVLRGAAGLGIDGGTLRLADGSVFAANIGGAARILTGGAGNDVLIAGDGGDTLIAGGGSDRLIGGAAGDLFVLGDAFANPHNVDGGEGEDTLTAAIRAGETYYSSDRVEHMVFSWTGDAGTAELTLTTPDLRRVDATALTAGQNARIDAAFAAPVLMTGGAGDDTLIGADKPGGDTLAGGDGRDSLVGNQGDDSLDGGLSDDTLAGGVGADTMTGGAGADVFVFLAGDSGFTTATVDHITDFAAGTDRIAFAGPIDVFSDQRLVDLSDSPDLASAALAARGLAAAAPAQAVLFVYLGRDYLYLDDDNREFSTVDDLLVDVTGFAGVFTAGDIM